MSLLYELTTKYRTLSIVGMAKNAGKTTALNYLIEEAMDEGITLGVTSTGRDGENIDLVTGTDKPKVFLYEDTLVSVPKGLYDKAEAGLEIVRMTEYNTSIGQIMMCKVRSSGYVQIAGPVATSDNKMLCREMIENGAQLVLIDGAIDRKAIASPGASDAIILSTGAVLSRNIKKVVAETAHVVNLFRLPKVNDREVCSLIKEDNNQDKIIAIKGGKAFPIEVKTCLASGKFIDDAIDEKTEYVYLPGALTESVLREISPKKFTQTKFILKDPTRIFVDSIKWQQLQKKGLDVSVLEDIQIGAITVNPFSPTGYSFEHGELVEEMKRMVEDIPVIDVRI